MTDSTERRAAELRAAAEQAYHEAVYIAFIEARLAEQQAEAEKARKAADGPGGDGQLWVVTGSGNAVGVDYDPARVLRQCAMMRVALSWYINDDEMVMGATIQAIAAIWSDHPDYQRDWDDE